MVIIDLSTPDNPTEVGSLPLSGFAEGIVVNGDYAYAVGYERKVSVIDISNSGNPTLVRQIDVPDDPERPIIADGVLYISVDDFGRKF